MAPTVNPFFFSLIFLSLLSSFSNAIRGHHEAGFTASLFHRDSPLSPLYNSSLTPYDRLKNAFLRSSSRSKHLSSRAAAAKTPGIIQSTIAPGDGEFLMEVTMGTPPMKFVAIADTGSDLTWTQCKPCDACFKQWQPIFDPEQSSSYKPSSCNASYCKALADAGGCSADKRKCQYSYMYGDGSSTEGDLGFETITLGSFVARNMAFGCGHDNEGSFQPSGSGIIGLGGGALSLVAQLNSTARIRPQFSYCLPNAAHGTELDGKINFGGSAAVSGTGVVSTPLIAKDPDTYYYLNLEGITVGNQRFYHGISNTTKAKKESGNIIIDSGTTLTYLPRELQVPVALAMAKAVKGKKVADPTGSGLFDTCYAADDVSDLNIPVVTAHFTGADVKLAPVNTFVKVADNVICLTLVPTTGLAIYGNLAQINFLVGYDLDSRKLSFKPTTCA